jgi:hypothetical protein
MGSIERECYLHCMHLILRWPDGSQLTETRKKNNKIYYFERLKAETILLLLFSVFCFCTSQTLLLKFSRVRPI